MKNLERELNWLYDLAYNVVNPANKEYTDNAYKTIKESLERLEKLEKVVEILKDEFHLDILEDGYFGCIDLDYNSINPDDLPKEQYDLLKEEFGG